MISFAFPFGDLQRGFCHIERSVKFGLAQTRDLQVCDCLLMDTVSESRHRPGSDQMIKIVIGLRHICRLVKGNDYVQQQIAHGEDFLYVFVFQAAMLSDVTVAFLLQTVNENLRVRHQIYVGRAQDLTLRHCGQETIEGTDTLKDVLPRLCRQQIRDAAVCSENGDMLFLWVDSKAPVRELTASE